MSNQNKIDSINKNRVQFSDDTNDNIYEFEINSNEPTLTEQYLEENFGHSRIKSENLIKNSKNYLIKNFKPSKICMIDFFFKRFPFFKWIKTYDVKENFLKDFIAGLTIGIVNVPQAMAYSFMIGVPAANGLYVTFFTTIIYLILGTSKHISVGTDAILSLIILSAIDKYKGVLYAPFYIDTAQNKSISTSVSDYTGLDLSKAQLMSSSVISKSDNTNFYLSNDVQEARTLIAMTLTLLAGILQVSFSIFHIGFVTRYLSDAVVNGFTTGAAFHIVLSQVRTLLGITKTEEITIALAVIGNGIEIFKNIPNTNIVTLIISIISAIFIYVIKVHVNERFKKKLLIPIPVELIVLILGTIISYFGKFDEKWKVKIVGPVTLGIPAPRVPPVSIFLSLLGDSIAIAVVSFSINISLAKQFARKYRYEIEPNQEALAHGISNIVCSFFNGFPGCVALARCVILDQIGGKTQVYGIFSAIIVLIVVLFVGPLLKTLPNACLAAIIVVALRTRVIEFRNLPKLYRKNKMEALAWLATYLGVMILDVDYGLYIGLIFSLLLVIFKSQKPRASVLGNIPGTIIYESIDAFKHAKEFKSIKIIRYEESIYYANVENFKYKILKIVNINPAKVKANILKEANVQTNFFNKNYKCEKKKFLERKKSLSECYPPVVVDLNENSKVVYQNVKQKIISSLIIKYIIIDCSSINYIDSQGVDAILSLYQSFKDIGINLYLSHCKQKLVKSFKKFSLQETLELNNIFATTHEAISYIIQTSNTQIEVISNKNNLLNDNEYNGI